MGTPEAVALGVRLAAWHDAMVAHERRLRSTPSKDGCDDECPHAEARALWDETVEMFGPRAYELTFLRARGNAHGTSRFDASPVSLARQIQRTADGTGRALTQ
jgi:hypothetical protein